MLHNETHREAVFSDRISLSNRTDREAVFSDRISLSILDMTVKKLKLHKQKRYNLKFESSIYRHGQGI